MHILHRRSNSEKTTRKSHSRVPQHSVVFNDTLSLHSSLWSRGIVHKEVALSSNHEPVPMAGTRQNMRGWSNTCWNVKQMWNEDKCSELGPFTGAGCSLWLHLTPCPSLDQPCLTVGAPDTTSRPPRAVVSLSASDFWYHRHHPGSTGREVLLGRELVASLHSVRADGHAREGGEEAGHYSEAERPRQPVDVEARHPRAVDADHHAKCRHRYDCTGDWNMAVTGWRY